MSETAIENLTNYELMLILPPNLGEESSLKELAEIKKLITSGGGDIYHEDIWGLKEFSYKIKKYNEGFYIVLNFKAEGNKILELEKEFNLNQKVIRYLMIKTPKQYELKTLEEYQAEAKKAKAEAEERKKEKEKSRTKPKAKKPAVEPELKKIPKEEVAVEEVKVEKVKEKEAKEEEAKEEEAKEEEAKEEEVKEEEVKEEEVKEEEAKEEEAKKPEEKVESKGEADLADLDEKLKSIINDPDISL